MRSFRYYLRFIYEFISKFKGLLVIGLIVGIGVFFLFNIASKLVFERKIARIGVTGRYHTGNLPKHILNQIGDGLTKINPDGTVAPDLASSWESPDKGKTWIFTIDTDNLWQDGKKVNSESIIYEFNDLDIEKPDEKTIIFKLNEPFSHFPGVVAKPTFKKGLLGTGDWQVDKISIAGSFVETLIISDNERNIKIYKFYPTEERTKLAFTLGEIDIIEDLYNPDPLNNWTTTKVDEIVQLDKIVTIFFNNSDKYLSEKSLRQALIYAIDKNSLGERAISPISSASWAFNPQVKKYQYNPDRAKEIFKDLPDAIKNDLNLTLVSTPDLLSTAEIIANYWRVLGINVNVLVSSIVPNEYQAYLTIVDLPDDPDQYSFWHSTQEAANISNYQNQRIDKLLEDGRVELNLEERKRIYLDFQRFLVEDSPTAFLYYPKTYTIFRK